ncbi:unnamed protein product [Amoebophrya sp. A25]|nr:unnamed protein product [Amoebophrya sp. A25]|eukprot:GSA25T00011576001.1
MAGKEEWRQGWTINEHTQRKAPLWTTLGRKDALQTVINRNGPHNAFTELKPSAELGTIKSRNTWIQKHMRATQWQPGPGAYKHAGDFPSAKEDIDRQQFRERGGNFSFTRDVRETVYPLKDVVKKSNNNNYPHYTSGYVRNKATRAYQEAPGPGHYTQYTTLGQGTWKK